MYTTIFWKLAVQNERCNTRVDIDNADGMAVKASLLPQHQLHKHTVQFSETTHSEWSNKLHSRCCLHSEPVMMMSCQQCEWIAQNLHHKHWMLFHHPKSNVHLHRIRCVYSSVRRIATATAIGDVYKHQKSSSETEQIAALWTIGPISNQNSPTTGQLGSHTSWLCNNTWSSCLLDE